ncbi:MAG: TetR/AcrR family transcriptional regulator [Thermoanaerobaculia bacterium]|nr:TetR/AcrR family transcriptional regulator [Thermoanaerobaculia bacterium]
MGPKERIEKEKAETRDRILDAARELFAEKGFEAVTMRQIAQKIEYTPTTIYVHFKDKDALLHEICDRDFSLLAQKFVSVAKLSDPIEQLRKTGLLYARFGLENRHHYRLMFMSLRPEPTPELIERKKGNPSEDAYEFLVMIIRAGLAAGRFRPEFKDPELIAQTVWAGIHGVVSLRISNECDPWVKWPAAERSVKTMIDVLVNGLVREEAARA